jgi:hypothetical protein
MKIFKKSHEVNFRSHRWSAFICLAATSVKSIEHRAGFYNVGKQFDLSN